MPLDPSILAQTKPFQTPDPLQNYAKVLQIQGAQQQLQNAGIQQQVSQMQLEDMKRDREEMVKFQQELVAKGGNPDLRQYAQMLLQSPKHFQTGIELLQKLDQQDQLSKIMGGGITPPVNALAPAAAAVAPEVLNNALAGQPRSDLKYVPGTPAEVSTMPYVTGTPAERMPLGVPGQTPPTRAAGVNALALPAPGRMAATPPVAPAMAAPVSDQAQETLKKINQLYALGTPQAINMAKGLEAQMKFLESRIMTPQQQAAENRAQQQLGMERERLELSKEEAQRKRAEVPSETRKELTSIDQQRSVIDGALKAVKDTPSAFSLVRGAAAGALPYGESLMGRTETPEQTQARAYVFNNVSRVINERAGAAQSAQEMQRLRAFLPADTDNAEQITNKLKGFQMYLQDLEKGTIKAAPAAAKESLEKTRKPQLSARDQQALEWANANAGDPRAAQIKQRLEVQ